MKWLIRTFIIVLTLAVISNSLICMDEIVSKQLLKYKVSKIEYDQFFSNQTIFKTLRNHRKSIVKSYNKVRRLENEKANFEYLANATVVAYDSTHIAGAGVCIRQDENYYYIISALHVVTPSFKNNVISIRLRNNIMVAGEIIKRDLNNDLALIRVTKQTEVYLEVVKIAENNLKSGDVVYAVGHPLGYEYMLTKGIVSSTRHSKFILSNIVIAYGNSGGGLFNINEELVGINVRISRYDIVLGADKDGNEFKIPAPLFALSAAVKTDIIKEFLNGE